MVERYWHGKFATPSGHSSDFSPLEVRFRFERTVVGIDPASQTLILDIPLVMSLDPRYPPAKVYEVNYKGPMISDVGVENLRLSSECNPVDPEDDMVWVDDG